MFFVVLIVVVVLQNTNGVIYDLDEDSYNLMPPIYDLDNYTSCLGAGGRYCTLDITVVSNTTNTLSRMIQEYTDYTQMHFNHTRLLYGRCIQTFCPEAEHITIESGLKSTLEGCLNRSFTKTYNLQTKINKISCSDLKNNNIDVGDAVVAVLLIVLVLLNVLGTAQHYIVDGKKSNKFLACFSMPGNLQTLFGPRQVPDVRMAGLSAFYGLRSMTAAFVFASHSTLPFIIGPDNPKVFEEYYNNVFKYMATGTIIVQTFFALSGFLLCYNTLIYQEKRSISIWSVPMKILLRWFRLTSPVLIVLGVTCTWLRFTEYGPFWQTVIGDMIGDCRRDWWKVPLYIINYTDDTQCAAELWYIASDFHLSVLGLFVLVLLKGRARVTVLVLVVVGSLVAPSLHIYYQDLDLSTIARIETGRNFFVKEPSFNHFYKRSHNNMTNFIVGMLTALAVYRWQNNDVYFEKHSSLRYLVWVLFPINFVIMLSGSVFFYQGPILPAAYRIPYLLVSRVMWAVMICSFIVSFVFGIEKLYSGILSWSVWTVPARLSYVAYVIHISVIRCLFGFNTSLAHLTPMFVTLTFLKTVTLVFLLAAPIWLLVEAPMTNVMKVMIGTGRSGNQNVDTNGKPGLQDSERNDSSAVNNSHDVIFPERFRFIDPDLYF